MAFSSKLLSFVVLLLLVLVLAKKVVSQGDTTTFTYDRFSPENSTSLMFQGDAFIPIPLQIVRLTKQDSSNRPTANSTGRVVYFHPVKLWDEGVQAAFQTTLQFIIRRSIGTPQADIQGEGLAFFISPVNSAIPPSSYGGNFGLFDPPTGLSRSVFAVEFDPFSNPWDPSYAHIGIDINSRVSRIVSALPLLENVVTADITYVPSTRTITVVANFAQQRFTTLTHVFDLKTILPKRVHVGITASTGSAVALHELRSWHFTSSLVSDKTYVPQYA